MPKIEKIAFSYHRFWPILAYFAYVWVMSNKQDHFSEKYADQKASSIQTLQAPTYVENQLIWKDVVLCTAHDSAAHSCEHAQILQTYIIFVNYGCAPGTCHSGSSCVIRDRMEFPELLGLVVVFFLLWHP